ncbi:MAG: Ig-like domain-containing protein, partial [Micromonosporaceae bacterium]
IVSTSGSPVPLGTTVVFTATVTAVAPGAGLATGTVQFWIDGVAVGAPASLNSSGQAAFAVSTLTVGAHTVSAVYSGAGNFNPSTSGTITQRIQ